MRSPSVSWRTTAALMEAGDRRKVPAPTQRPRGGHDAHVADPRCRRRRRPDAAGAGRQRSPTRRTPVTTTPVAPARQVASRTTDVALFQPRTTDVRTPAAVTRACKSDFLRLNQWPFTCGRRRWAPPFNHTGRPFSIPKRHCSQKNDAFYGRTHGTSKGRFPDPSVAIGKCQRRGTRRAGRTADSSRVVAQRLLIRPTRWTQHRSTLRQRVYRDQSARRVAIWQALANDRLYCVY